MKILTVVGARPQFVKVEPLSRALGQAGIEHTLVHTGQHWDYGMSDVFFEEMNIPQPDVNLGVGSGPHGAQTARMLEGLEVVFMDRKPDSVVVFGDTNSTLAGALAAAKLHIPLAHVEAGLRSWNRLMPEEINRVLTDHASDLLFAPTDAAVRNLQAEGIPEERVKWSGDIMQDAFQRFAGLAEQRSSILNRHGLRKKEYVLATIHRAENTDNAPRLRTLIEAMRLVADQMQVVLPLHPRTRAAIAEGIGATANLCGVKYIEPAGYLDMIALESHAAVIATDSGGVQKEAFFARVPCVTLRDETEWVELVEMGWNKLCPPTSAESTRNAILEAVGSSGIAGEPYGDGTAAPSIVSELAHIGEVEKIGVNVG